jgi:D-glycero-D-manno-heptose 1,7-bisphosphate phosphatase
MIPSANSSHHALFLDRDGVINENHGYVHSIEDFDFIDGIFDLVRTANRLGYRVVVITNQAGIGRGYYSERQFQTLTAWMCAEFRRAGATINKVYFSPYHPTSGIGKYRKRENTRKPGPGMILKAKHELGLSLMNSILVGDSASDILAGAAAGVRTNILLSNYMLPELDGVNHQLASNLRAIIPCLQDNSDWISRQ